MAVDFDAKLTQLAAEILRDAVQVYDPSERELLLSGFNPAFGAWNVGTVGATGSFPAITGSFPVITGSLPALTDIGLAQAAPGATGTLKAVTGSFRAFTESFRAIGQDRAEPTVTLRRVFKLPAKLAGVRLPPDTELGQMARSAPTMTALDALARWLGRDGRVVTADDDLTEADAGDVSRRLGIRPPSLSFLWEYALTSGWFELNDSADRQRTWAVIGQTAWRWAKGDDRGALHVWAAVFASVLAKTFDVMTAAAPDAARRLGFDGQGVALAVMLFMSRRSGVTVRDVEDFLRDGAIGNQPTTRLKRAWDTWVRQHGHPAHHLLSELARLHAVRPPRMPGGTIELTPLTLWALRAQFVLDKISVPVLAPPSPQMSPAALVALSDAVSDAEFDASFATWMHGRDPDQAVRELLIYATSGGPHGRVTAVDIARRIGLPAYRGWKDAMRHPELRGYARITLSMMAGDLPESTLPLVLDPDPDDMAWLATDLLAMACGAEQPDPDEIARQFADAVPAGEEAWIFGLMAQSSHPDIMRVLEVLGMYHRDRRIARDARKAARAITKNRRLVGHRGPARTSRP